MTWPIPERSLHFEFSYDVFSSCVSSECTSHLESLGEQILVAGAGDLNSLILVWLDVILQHPSSIVEPPLLWMGFSRSKMKNLLYRLYGRSLTFFALIFGFTLGFGFNCLECQKFGSGSPSLHHCGSWAAMMSPFLLPQKLPVMSPSLSLLLQKPPRRLNSADVCHDSVEIRLRQKNQRRGGVPVDNTRRLCRT